MWEFSCKQENSNILYMILFNFLQCLHFKITNHSTQLIFLISIDKICKEFGYFKLLVLSTKSYLRVRHGCTRENTPGFNLFNVWILTIGKSHSGKTPAAACLSSESKSTRLLESEGHVVLLCLAELLSVQTASSSQGKRHRHS